MGTNLYWRDGVCDHCGRFEDIHVGKSSGGWSFLFRAYPHQLQSADHPEWGYDPQSPFGFPIASRSDWRTVLTTRSGELRNEYDDRIEHPLVWLEGLTPPDARQIKSEEDEMRRSRWSGYNETGWRDAEGFRFEPREFS